GTHMCPCLLRVCRLCGGTGHQKTIMHGDGRPASLGALWNYSDVRHTPLAACLLRLARTDRSQDGSAYLLFFQIQGNLILTGRYNGETYRQAASCSVRDGSRGRNKSPGLPGLQLFQIKMYLWPIGRSICARTSTAPLALMRIPGWWTRQTEHIGW